MARLLLLVIASLHLAGCTTPQEGERIIFSPTPDEFWPERTHYGLAAPPDEIPVEQIGRGIFSLRLNSGRTITIGTRSRPLYALSQWMPDIGIALFSSWDWEGYPLDSLAINLNSGARLNRRSTSIESTPQQYLLLAWAPGFGDIEIVRVEVASFRSLGRASFDYINRYDWRGPACLDVSGPENLSVAFSENADGSWTRKAEACPRLE